MKQPKNKQWLGILLLFFTAIIWGTAFLFQKNAASAGLGPFSFVFVRYSIAALALAIISHFMQKRAGLFNESVFQLRTYPGKTPGEKKIARKRSLLAGLQAGFFMFGGTCLQQTALETTSVGKTSFITTLYVILFPLGAWLFFRKRPSWIAGLACLFGLLGLFFLTITPGTDWSLAPGDVLVLIGSVFWTCQMLSLEYFMKKGLNGVRISLLETAVTAILAGIGMLLFEEPSLAQFDGVWGSVLYTALMSSVIAFTCQIYGQEFVEPVTSGLILSLESVFGTLSAALFLHEVLSLRETVGAALMFCGVVLSQLPAKIPGKKRKGL